VLVPSSRRYPRARHDSGPDESTSAQETAPPKSSGSTGLLSDLHSPHRLVIRPCFARTPTARASG
jgi:hypothetical protein